MTDKVRELTIKMVAAGNFSLQRDGDDSSTKSRSTSKWNVKRGATFAAVEEESESNNKEPDPILPTYEGISTRTV